MGERIMDKGVIMGVFIFSISISLIGGYFGVGELDDGFSSEELIQGLNQISSFDSAGDVYAGVTTVFGQIIPSTTGVLWFDLLVFGGISIAFGLLLFYFITHRGI